MFEPGAHGAAVRALTEAFWQVGALDNLEGTRPDGNPCAADRLREPPLWRCGVVACRP
jgi:hypothetical protein